MKLGIETKIAGFIMVVCLLLGIYGWGYGHGEASEKAEWEAKEKIWLVKENDLRQAHANKIAAMNESFHQTNVKNHQEHEAAVQEVRTALDLARAESRRRGGLQFTATCSGASGTAQAESSIAHHEGTTTTIALPERIEDSLWTLVGQADEVTEQLRSCQKWIKDNGMY